MTKDFYCRCVDFQSSETQIDKRSVKGFLLVFINTNGQIISHDSISCQSVFENDDFSSISLIVLISSKK